MRLKTRADELHRIETPDGWPLALWWFRSRHPRPGPPVLLCHGLGSNRFNLDFGRYSLARRLVAEGYNVFNLELRGSGLSGKLADKRVPRETRWAYNFDDHVRDAIVVLDEIEALTGEKRVFWIGHSMGGMIAYTLISGDHRHRIAGAVALASPGTFHRQPQRVRRAAHAARFLFPRKIPAQVWARAVAPLTGWIRPRMQVGPANFSNMSGPTVRRALFNVVGDISRGELDQFTEWMAESRWCSRDGAVDYFDQLAHAEAPTLLIAGSLDRLAPPESVRDVYEQLGSTDKTILIAGTESGAPEAFGHGDIVLSDAASRYVFPRIFAWLEERHPKAAGDQREDPVESAS